MMTPRLPGNIDVLRFDPAIIDIADDPLGHFQFKPLPTAGAGSWAYETMALVERTPIGPGVAAGCFFKIGAYQSYLGMPGINPLGYGLAAGTYAKAPLLRMNGGY